jgi:hypothetical protein
MENLHTNGYAILKNAISIPESMVGDLLDQIEKKGGPIFNSSRNDNKRLQCNLKPNKEYSHIIRKIEKNVQEINPLLIPSKWAIIYSKIGCKKQLAHLDYENCEEFQNVIKEDNKTPLLVIVAVMPGTAVYLWEGSVQVIQGIQPSNTCKGTKIMLDVGDILVFRADMVHCGSDYDQPNVRLHCYMDSPFLARNPNRTWIISKHADENIKKLFVEYLFPKKPKVSRLRTL